MKSFAWSRRESLEFISKQKLKEIRTDYIRFLLHRARTDLSRYNVTGTDSEMINRLFDRILRSKNLLKDLYVLSNIPEFKNLGKHLVYVLKKLEDGVIGFGNVAQNVKNDKEYLESEILNLLSNPQLRKTVEVSTEEVETFQRNDSEKAEPDFTIAHPEASAEEDFKTDEKTETEEEDFKKNYLELIYSESKEEDFVYEIPKLENAESGTGDETTEDADGEGFENEAFSIPEEIQGHSNENQSEDGEATKTEETFETTETTETTEAFEATESTVENIPEEIPADDTEEFGDAQGDSVEELAEEQETDKELIEIHDGKDRITLSREIQDDLETYVEEEEIEDDPEEAITEEPPANAMFLEFEEHIIGKNEELKEGFEKMINFSTNKPDDNERDGAILKIMAVSSELELHSQKMSLEIISNVYNTITLSFEKISEGKYDLSESTLKLFGRGLSLVESLIKGDDYFGYKDILKSIENIRSALLEDKKKREEYARRTEERKQAEKELSQSFANEGQKEKFLQLRDLIKDTEVKLKHLDRISGEYQIYEALRSISIPLNNFKEIVKIARELDRSKLVKLSEGSYVFIKFLQNYRINPVSSETKEIFDYIVFNLKSLAMGKESEDLDLFISYLNDPVKIFSNTKKSK